ncbi:Uncharacterised protein [Clostridium disporicum]|jgi:hypothetical protein|uniref:Uncharacterized protein n=1 Tax=Clostridium disporicum TaxID=84024 RepID=A0A174HLF2_9CLOT|nr:Uncharacterised protein [Clostridium disporicum]SCJ47818.1 Uncharacterised protein [uncultured Clostridium sp.]
MNIKILRLYVDNCRQMHKMPTWEGLNEFNKVFK